MIKVDKTQHTILLVFLVSFLCIAFFALKSFIDLKQAYLRSDSEIVTLRVLRAVGNLNNNLHNINESQNNYLLTGGSSHLAGYTEALDDFPNLLRQLHGNGVTDSLERAYIQQVLAYAEDYVEAVQRGMPTLGEATQPRADSLWLEQKSELLQQAEKYINSIEELERQNFAATDLARQKEIDRAFRVFLVFSMGMFFLFLFNFFQIKRSLFTRKKAEQTLDENQELFSTLFYKSATMLTLIDVDLGTVVDVNEASLRFFNNRKEGVIGRRPEDFAVKAAPEDQLNMERILSENEQIKDYEIKLNINDSEKYLSFSVDKINLGGKLYLLLSYIDVTDKKLAEEKLKESELLFSTLFYKSPVNFYICEVTQDRLLDVNENFLSFFGFTRQEVVGKTTASLQLWDDEEAYVSLLAGVKIIGGGANKELQVRKRSGELCYILIHGELLQLNGKDCMVGAFVDISASKLAEATIKRLNATLEQKVLERTKEISDYKFALDQSSIVAITDQDRRLRYVNDNFIKISGYSRQELIGQRHLTVSPAINADDVIKKIELAKQQGIIWKGEIRNQAKDGSIYWTDTTIVPFLDEKGVPYQFLSIRWDITDKKKGDSALLQAMHELEMSSNRLKEAQALAHLGSWEHNFKTGETVWSEETFRILGTTAAETTPSVSAFYNLVHPDDRSAVAAISRQLAQQTHGSSFECRIVRKDGLERHLFIQYDVFLDQDNKVIRWNGIAHDITERVLSQQEKDKVTADLIQRNKDLQQFNYIISHNLRAPVVNILGLTNLMDKLSPTTERFAECLKGVRVSVLKLDEVILDLNNILQIRQEIKEAKEDVSLSELVQDIETVLANRIMVEKAVITTHFNGLDQFYTLKSYLYSIFYNLVSNSIKYRRQDAPPHIQITGKLIQDKVQLVFSDNGLGINLARYNDKIFGLYKRFHFHTEGKGMGLFMVKTQVEILGGKISVESEEGKGTEFTLEFDAQEVLPAATAPHAGPISKKPGLV
ncbi:PAS domain S-box protein [Pontibacter qinzhouensis]|uniref:histidine kinase n=1 Tax=Pontibacter qinzhouensis TaxID=2603253 RepID=A0A5C8K3A1_9BACT|nr:PAS domain S-box protein [Pontibacter qinzhouensis]TXK44142.1 PAS domain S-box protein [Pontibacter qinzhouensis]